jgi:hypothetical protein
LVHTDRGLLPIEDIHIGMQVLSQPEDGGERGYRQVIHAVAHLDQPVHAVQIEIDGSEERSTVLATGNHPFWVEAPLVGEKHWMAAECLEAGFVVQLADGRKARIRATGIVRRTQYQKIGFAADDRSGIGMVFDLTEGIRLASDTRSIDSDRLELGEPFLTPVHNFEVDGFHTYYVGEAGVWVHNAECSKEVALESALREAEFVPRKTELESACFVGDTGILIEKGSGRVKGIGYDVTTIEEIWMAFAYYAGIRNWDDFDEWPEVSAEEAGFDWKVLSRDPRTGEMVCKRILKVYNHGFRKVSEIYYKYGPKYLAAWENDTLPSQGSGQRTNILSGFRARAGFRCATCNPETNS